MKNAWIVSVALMAIGCSQQPVASTGNDALGIVEFQVAQTATALEIQGLDAQQSVVGHLVLSLGSVNLAEEGLAGDGRALMIEVKGRKAEHKSVGMTPLALPLFDAEGEDLNTFLVDAHVASALATWGVTFVPDSPVAGDEAAYSACRHAASGSCGVTGCAAESASGGSTEYEYACCGSSKTAVRRMCGECTTGCSGTNACGAIGPLGCSVCWSQTYTTSCTVGDCGATGAGYLLNGSTHGMTGCTPSCLTGVCGASDGCGGQCSGTCSAGNRCEAYSPLVCGSTYSCVCSRC